MLEVISARDGVVAGFATFGREPVYFDHSEYAKGYDGRVYSMWRVPPDLVGRWALRADPSIARELTASLHALRDPSSFATATLDAAGGVTWQRILKPKGARLLPRIHAGLGLYDVESEAQRLRAHWKRGGIHRGDVPAAELRRLASLPADYLTLLRIAGWANDCDDEQHYLWEPARISAESEHPFILIGDYMQESWWYGLGVRGPSCGRAAILPNARPEPSAIVGTVGEFAAMIVADDHGLYDV
ncbi:MAG TPA: hypothetical protein VGM88_00130 [Kofleriaceae bacterium]